MVLVVLFPRHQKKLYITFYPQTNGQIKRENSTIEVYLKPLINEKQNNWIRLLSIAEFIYNNIKNANTSHNSLKLNCEYHSRVLVEDETNFYSRFYSANKLVKELR